MKDEQALEVRGHQLNSLSNHQLKDVIAMSIAERIPIEKALTTHRWRVSLDTLRQSAMI